MEETPSLSKRRRFSSRCRLPSLLCCRPSSVSTAGSGSRVNSIVSPFWDSETTLLARVGAEPLCLAFCRLRREFLEHLRDALVQVLFIFLGLIGERVFGTASPAQLLFLRVVHVNHQGSLFIVLFGCRRLAEPSASKSSPTPSSTHTVIEGLK